MSSSAFHALDYRKGTFSHIHLKELRVYFPGNFLLFPFGWIPIVDQAHSRKFSGVLRDLSSHSGVKRRDFFFFKKREIFSFLPFFREGTFNFSLWNLQVLRLGSILHKSTLDKAPLHGPQSSLSIDCFEDSIQGCWLSLEDKVWNW